MDPLLINNHKQETISRSPSQLSLARVSVIDYFNDLNDFIGSR